MNDDKVRRLLEEKRRESLKMDFLGGFFHLQIVIESGQRFDEQIAALIAEFITASREDVKSLVQIEIVMAEKHEKSFRKKTNGNAPRAGTVQDGEMSPVKVSSNEWVDLLLGQGVQILKLMDGRVLFHVQSVRCDEICGKKWKIRSFSMIRWYGDTTIRG